MQKKQKQSKNGYFTTTHGYENRLKLETIAKLACRNYI